MLNKINNEINLSSSYQVKSNNNSNTQFVLNEKKEDNNSHNNTLSYVNINGISIEEIEKNFIDGDNKSMAKSLRLATLFSEDEVLSQALFNTVLGYPFDIGFSILNNRYSDKNIFLNKKDSSLSSLLHESMLDKDKNISQEKIDEILLKAQSINFIDSLLNTSKDQYDRYKDDKNNDYSFLYNDYVLQYEDLLSKYQNIENLNKNIISQF